MKLPARVLLALAAGVAGVWIAISLGNWHTERAEGKLAIEARWRSAEAAAPRTITPANLSLVPGELHALRQLGRHE